MDPGRSSWRPGSGRNYYLSWKMTKLCNYRCEYCFDAVYHRSQDKSRFKGQEHQHAFANHSPREWLQAMSRFSPSMLVLKITGGEPFADFNNFLVFLAGLSRMEQVKCIRVDTNGFWSAKKISDIDWKKITVNISFHPTQITFDRFFTSVKEKIQNGVNVGMVNFVLAPGQLDLFPSVEEKFQEIGVFVNANVLSENEMVCQTEAGHLMYPELIPDIDVKIKTGKGNIRGGKCYFPTVAYKMDPMGNLKVGCLPEIRGNLFDHELPVLEKDAVVCQKNVCGCLDEYAFLSCLENRGNEFNLLLEYTREVKKHRESRVKRAVKGE